MKLSDIKEKASQESEDSHIQSYVDQIKKLIVSSPAGSDIYIPPRSIKKVEDRCDELKIPCMSDGEYLSVAATYSILLDYDSIEDDI